MRLRLLIHQQSDAKKRAENRTRREKMLNWAPDNLAQEALNEPNRGQNHDNEQEGNENLTPQERLANEQRKEMREAMNALQKERGVLFTKAAAMTNVNQLGASSDDSESEEDPDDDPSPQSGKESKKRGSDGDDNLDEEIERFVEDAEFSAPGEEDSQIVPPLPDMSHGGTNPAASSMNGYASSGDNTMLWIYTVYERETVDGVEGPAKTVDTLVDMKEANARAIQRFDQYRPIADSRNETNMNGNGLYAASMILLMERNRTITIFVDKSPQATNEIANFDPAVVKNRFPKVFYELHLTTWTSQWNKEKQRCEHMPEKQIVPNRHFTVLEMANHEACSYFIEFVKPKSANLEFHELHANHVGPELRAQREAIDAHQTCFDIEIDIDDESMQWMEPYTKIRMEVEAVDLKGPLN